MMRYFNPFYLLLILLSVGFYYVFAQEQQETLSFYGFAESNETEINYNYPTVVDHIPVTPGQEVEEGDVLLRLSRVKAKETLADEEFKIKKLDTEAEIWKQKKQREVARIQLAKEAAEEEIQDEMTVLQKELDFKKSLVSGLKTIEARDVDFSPIQEKINLLNTQLERVTNKYDATLYNLDQEIKQYVIPYRQEVARLKEEADFDTSQAKQEIIVTAPTRGLVGNIYCKEAEHIPSFKTLLSFYEPHSGTIKGYVHEDLILKVDLGALFTIASLKDDTIKYEGRVIGLGSRIVEIPLRLRKMPEIKTYGREVLIEITKDNSFLQKEKVAVTYVRS